MYTLPLPPMGTNHSYHTNKGRWFKDSKIVNWETVCLYKLKGKTIATSGNVKVEISFFDGDKRRRDIDGRIKCVLDLFTKAGAYKDDSLVTCLEVKKRFDKQNPRLEVSISGIDF